MLDKAIDYAKETTTVNNSTIEIIKHSRTSLLFDNNDTWIKKGSNPMFDVTMGCYDGGEVCEPVGLYLLSKWSKLLKDRSLGLYRDDGFAVVSNANGLNLDRLRKKIIVVFKEEKLSITTATNLEVADFLDVTLDLPQGTYYLYRKPNNRQLILYQLKL